MHCQPAVTCASKARYGVKQEAGNLEQGTTVCVQEQGQQTVARNQATVDVVLTMNGIT
jgi:hypothetical protein